MRSVTPTMPHVPTATPDPCHLAPVVPYGPVHDPPLKGDDTRPTRAFQSRAGWFRGQRPLRPRRQIAKACLYPVRRILIRERSCSRMTAQTAFANPTAASL